MRSDFQLEGFEGQPKGLRASERGLRASRRGPRASRRGLRMVSVAGSVVTLRFRAIAVDFA